jgi:predicted Zn finger-like uncharacterized protein
MRLITTCPNCDTSFRVVADQLKLHRGMVRCGKCRSVFSGMERLRQIPDTPPGHGTAPVAPVPAQTPVADTTQRPSEPGKTPLPTPARPGIDLDSPPPPIGRPEAPRAPGTWSLPEQTSVAAGSADRPATDSPSADPAPQPPAPADPVPADPVPADPVPVAPPAVFRKPPGRRTPPARADTARPATESAPPVLDTEPDDDDLRLARELEAAAREIAAGADDEQAIDFFSTDSRRRGLLARHGVARVAAVAMLIVLLAAQGMLASRHYLVARLPALEPAVTALAASLGLSIELPRALDALSIEAFELQQTDAPGLFSVAAIVRNDAGHAVRWPSMLLTLTDPVNRVLVRKAIHPADFLDPGAIPGGLRARSERPIRIALEVSDLQPAGYSVVLFYR